MIEVVNGNSLLTPAFGPVGGGTTMFILGANLEDASAVNFGGNDEGNPGMPGTIQFDSANEIQVVSPGGGEGTDAPRVVTPDGFAALAYVASSDDGFTYTAEPIVTGLSTAGGGTAVGSVVGGTTVTISGSNLSDATAVDFGGIPAASFTVTRTFNYGHQPRKQSRFGDGDGHFAGRNIGRRLYAAIRLLVGPDGLGSRSCGWPLGGRNTVEIIGTGLTYASEVDFGGVPATASAFAT